MTAANVVVKFVRDENKVLIEDELKEKNILESEINSVKTFLFSSQAEMNVYSIITTITIASRVKILVLFRKLHNSDRNEGGKIIDLLQLINYVFIV